MTKCGAITNGVSFLADGTIAPCCQVDRKFCVDVSTVRNANRFDNVEENFEEACRVCVNSEKNNIASMRQGFNRMHNPSDTGLQFVEIQNSNHCNLACKICGPHSSDKWGRILGLDNPLQFTDLTEYYDQIVTPSLKQVYFTGGEPLLNSTHYELLNLLVEKGYSKNIHLAYSTNCTVTKYKGIEFETLWNKFERVSIQGSIDAIGARFEEIRPGVSWDIIERNLMVLKKYNFSIMLTLSKINLLDLKETLEYFEALGIPLKMNLVNEAHDLSLARLPEQEKTNAIEMLEALAHNRKKLQPMLQYAQKMIRGEHE